MWVKLRAPHKHQTKSKVSLEGEMKPHYHQHHIKHGYFHLRLRYEKKNRYGFFQTCMQRKKIIKLLAKSIWIKWLLQERNIFGSNHYLISMWLQASVALWVSGIKIITVGLGLLTKFFIRFESSLVTTENFWKAAPMSSDPKSPTSSRVNAVSPKRFRALEKSNSTPTWSVRRK